jgi:hypothetical protein
MSRVGAKALSDPPAAGLNSRCGPDAGWPVRAGALAARPGVGWLGPTRGWRSAQSRSLSFSSRSSRSQMASSAAST